MENRVLKRTLSSPCESGREVAGENDLVERGFSHRTDTRANQGTKGRLMAMYLAPWNVTQLEPSKPLPKRSRRGSRIFRKRVVLTIVAILAATCCFVQVYLLNCCHGIDKTAKVELLQLGIIQSAAVSAQRLSPNIHIPVPGGPTPDIAAIPSGWANQLVNQPAHILVKRDAAITQNISMKYLTPNEILRRTAVGIKTFNRPDCLRLTVKSFRTFYPEIAIFVADDSFDDDLKNITNEGIRYLRLPPDSGVAYGRNRLVRAIYDAGYEYMVMSDDDYTLNQHDDLLLMAQRLLLTGADVLAPIRCDYGHCERSKGTIHVSHDRHVTIFPNITVYPPEKIATCHRSDMVQQFFISRTKTILDVGWDDVLKNNDHYDFLFNAKSRGLRLVTCTDIHVIHDKKTCQLKSKHFQSYVDTRQERWYKLLTYVFQKWSLRKITDESGKAIWLQQNGSAAMKFADKTALNRTDPLHSYFVSAAVNKLNVREPGWTWIRPFDESRRTYIVYKKHHDCIYYVAGKIDGEYDRHKDYPNKKLLVSFSMYHFNRSCHLAEDLWTMRYYGREARRHVYYVVSVANDLMHLRRLLKFFQKDQDSADSSLIIVDMGGANSRIQQSLINSEMPVHLVYLGPPFSRSIGLKKGMELATSLARKAGHEDAIGFAIDTSIVIPKNFSDIIRRNVKCGISAYAPICYKFKEDSDGYWVNTGYGMISMCLKDYHAAGGYDDRWGYKWGAEDVDLCNRLKSNAKLPYISRPQQEGFYHIHSGNTRKTYKGYYTKKNMYDKPLPVTPLTTAIPEAGLETRVANFARSRLEEKFREMNLEFLHAQQTHVNNGDDIWYDVRFHDRKNGENYFAIIASVLS